MPFCEVAQTAARNRQGGSQQFVRDDALWMYGANPAIGLMPSPLGYSIFNVVADGSVKQVFRVDASRVIAAMADMELAATLKVHSARQHIRHPMRVGVYAITAQIETTVPKPHAAQPMPTRIWVGLRALIHECPEARSMSIALGKS